MTSELCILKKAAPVGSLFFFRNPIPENINFVFTKYKSHNYVRTQ